MAKTRVTDSERGDVAFTQRYAKAIPASQFITVPRGNCIWRGGGPARGWPAYSALCPTGNPTQVARDPICISKNFRNLDATHGWVPGDAMEPLSRALSVPHPGRKCQPAPSPHWSELQSVGPTGKTGTRGTRAPSMETGGKVGAQRPWGVHPEGFGPGRHSCVDSRSGLSGSFEVVP